MKKERFKSVLLVTLVISSLLLTAQIWFNEKLWPEGYNFFVSMRASAFGKISNWFGQDESEPVKTKLVLAQPYHLVAYTVKDFDHAALELTPRNAEYETICSYVNEAIGNALTRQTKSLLKVSQEDWQKALFTRGLYVDFGFEYQTNTFTALIDTADSPLSESITRVQRFIITPGDNLSNEVYVCLCDEATGDFYRLPSGMDKTELEANLTALSAQASPANRFSFFLDADKPTEIAGEAIFDPYLVMSEQGVQLPTIKSINPVLRGGTMDININSLSRILKLFDINPNTVRKYTDADENLVFVQNQATLVVSPSGVVSYRAVSGKGLKLSESTAVSIPAYISVAIGANFSNKVINSLNTGEALGLRIRSFEEDSNKIKASFDYESQGIPIIFTGELEGQYAVTMELEGDYLKSYTQVVRAYHVAEDIHQTRSTVDSVNVLFERIPKEQRQAIDDMVIAYGDDGTESIKLADWFIRLAGQEHYMR